jgi:hypothetical protein
MLKVKYLKTKLFKSPKNDKKNQDKVTKPEYHNNNNDYMI